MILDALKIQIQKMLLESKYNNYLLKVWIYKEKCVVLDFNYKTIKFALDIEVDETLKSNIYLVDRNSHLNFLRDKTMLKRNKVIKKVEENKIDEELNSFLAEIFGLIDTEFKYQVSVIVPVYNREKLILKCIESLNQQTLSKDHFEVIFVDDCSTDNTIKVIQEKCVSDLNYSILKRPVGSGNASAPRNDGLNKAKGKYVFFLDSDDYISVDCLDNALSYAEKNESQITYLKMGTPADQARSIPIRVFKKGSVDNAKIWGNHLLRNNYVFKFFDRTFLKRNKIFFDVSFNVNEDKLFNIQVLSKARKVSILADKEYIYLVRHNDEHLGKSVADLSNEYLLYVKGYSYIFASENDEFTKKELYNGWTNILIERFISILKSKRYQIDDKYKYFKNSLILINYQDSIIDENQIYPNSRSYIAAIKEKNFDLFMKILENQSE